MLQNTIYGRSMCIYYVFFYWIFFNYFFLWFLFYYLFRLFFNYFKHVPDDLVISSTPGMVVPSGPRSCTRKPWKPGWCPR